MTTVTHSSLARETVSYAAQCLRAGERVLALEVVKSDASGLKPEHQQKLEQIIKGLGEQASPRELNLAEDRMIGVLQPETWAFLQDEKSVAEVLSFFDPYAPITYSVLKGNRLEALEQAALGIVHTPHFRMHQQLIRNALAGKTAMAFQLLLLYHKNLRNLENPDQTLSLGEFFQCCPNLEKFTLNQTGVLLLEQNSCSSDIVKAILHHSPNFKELHVFTGQFYRIAGAEHEDPLFRKAVNTFAPVVKKLVWDFNHYSVDDLNSFLKFPHLKDLSLPREPHGTVCSRFREIFSQFTRLERLHIKLNSEQTTCFEALATLPLKELKLECEGPFPDYCFLLLARMPNLQKIELSDVNKDCFMTYDELRQFILKSRKTLKEIILQQPYECENTFLTVQEIGRVKAEFPDVVIKYKQGNKYVTATAHTPGKEKA